MAATYEPIATQTLSTNTATVTFSSIPSTYTDLIIVVNAGQVTVDQYYAIRFNNDTGSNYSNTQIVGNGTTASSNRNTNTTVGYIHSTNESTIKDTVLVHVMNYTNTTTNKTTISRGNSTGYRVVASAILWRNTAAINRIDISGSSNLLSGSTFTVYGIKAA